jgi:hypothetical protein
LFANLRYIDVATATPAIFPSHPALPPSAASQFRLRYFLVHLFVAAIASGVLDPATPYYTRMQKAIESVPKEQNTSVKYISFHSAVDVTLTLIYVGRCAASSLPPTLATGFTRRVGFMKQTHALIAVSLRIQTSPSKCGSSPPIVKRLDC